MTFTDEFTAAVADIEARAKAVGENWATLCRAAKISRTTPDRWKKNPPATIRAITKLQSILAEREAAKAGDAGA